MLNKLLALKIVYQTKGSTLTYPEYFSASTALFSHLLSLPTERMTAGLYNVACEMWNSLAATTEDIDTIVNVTTVCLSKKSFLDNAMLFSFR